MDRFPAIPVAYGSDPELLDGRMVDRSSAGDVYVRSMWPAVKTVYPVKFQHITAAQRAEIIAFYETHGTAPFIFSSLDTPGDVVVTFDASPPRFRRVGPFRWNGELRLLEV